MSQKFLHLMVGEVEDKVAAELAKAGFRVARSDRMVGGLDVRVRSGTNDESVVMDIASRIAPDASRGPDGTPASNLRGYRAGL